MHFFVVRVLAPVCLAVIASSVAVTAGPQDQIVSPDAAMKLAREALPEEARRKFPDLTRIEWKFWVRSWWVLFENPQRTDGRWVMLDEHGKLQEIGKIYADH